MYQVSSRYLEEQPTLVMIDKVLVGDMPAWFAKVYRTVADEIGKSGLDFAGPPFARYRMLDETGEFEVESGFPVDRPGSSRGEVVASTLPEGTVAIVTHIGPYDQMTPAYEALEQWINDQGGRPAGPSWEVYYSDAVTQPDPATWRTDILQPYEVRPDRI